MVIQRLKRVKRIFNTRKTRKKKLRGSQAPPLDFNELEQILNGTIFKLFKRYRNELLHHSPLYLVPAVWGEGTKEFTELDGAQKAMHRVLAPRIEALTERFSQGAMDSNGISGTEYLLKGLVLYKMAYMVQYYLNCKGHQGEGMPGDKDPLLERMETLGRA